jgi:hypothetical protein
MRDYFAPRAVPSRRRRHAAVAALCVGSVLVLGCGGDSPAGPDTTPAALTLAAPATSIAAGSTMQLTVVATNAAGKSVPAAGVTYVSSAPTVVAVSASGLATAVGPTGTATVAASLGTMSAAPVALTVTAGPAARVTKVGSDPATVPTETSFGDSIRVQVADQFGNPVAGASVAFAVTAGGGTVAPSTATTDASGRAAARFVLGATPAAAHTATATVSGLPAATFTTTAVARERKLAALSYTGAPAQAAAVLTNGENVKVSLWTSTGRAGGALTQGAYVDARRAIDTRVLFGADGVPSRIYNPAPASRSWSCSATTAWTTCCMGRAASTAGAWPSCSCRASSGRRGSSRGRRSPGRSRPRPTA